MTSEDPAVFRLSVDRDNVHPGEELNNHREEYEVELDEPLRKAIEVVYGSFGLAYVEEVEGGKATWLLQGRFPLAVVAQKWRAPRFIVDENMPLREAIDLKAKTHLHYHFRGKENPEKLLAQEQEEARARTSKSAA